MNKPLLSILFLILVLSCPAFAQYPPVIYRFANEDTISKLKARYEDEIAITKAAGLPTQLSDVLPKYINDSQNAEPLYRGIFEKLPESAEEKAAVKEMSKSPDKIDWAKLDAFVKTHKQLLNQIHKAAPLLYYAAKHSPNDDFFTMRFPCLALCRRSARIICIESLVIAHQNKPADAINNVVLALNIAKQASQDVAVISWLVGVAIDAIAFRTLQKLEVMFHSNQYILAKIKSIASGWLPIPLTNAFKCELAAQSTQYILWIKNDLDYVEKIEANYSDTKPNTSLKSLYTELQWKAICYTDATAMLRTMRSATFVADKPYPIADKRIHGLSSNLRFLEKNIFYKVLYDVFVDLPSKKAQIVSIADITSISTDIFGYRLKHKEFPESLKSLNVSIPIDPYNLKPLKYRRIDDGFVIYSVGPSGKYDGNPTSSKSNPIVFRYSVKNGASWK